MKRLTIDKFSTVFQLIIIVLLFIYAAFPGKSKGFEESADNSLLVDKTIVTPKEVNPNSKIWVYNDKLPNQLANSTWPAWIIPDMKNIMNTRTGISADQSGNRLKHNTK